MLPNDLKSQLKSKFQKIQINQFLNNNMSLVIAERRQLLGLCLYFKENGFDCADNFFVHIEGKDLYITLSLRSSEFPAHEVLVRSSIGLKKDEEPIDFPNLTTAYPELEAMGKEAFDLYGVSISDFKNSDSSLIFTKRFPYRKTVQC